MPDYSLAGAHADVVHALAIIESNESVSAIGDGGRAFGLLQQHPSFFKEYYGRAVAFPQSVEHTWPEAQIVAAASFFEMNEQMGLDLIVQAYNLGVEAVRNGQRNPAYLSQFKATLARLK
ncbi:MAG: transglycosylase SLT domain-containing protein [Candidatus Acidiferrales bacterium]